RSSPAKPLDLGGGGDRRRGGRGGHRSVGRDALTGNPLEESARFRDNAATMPSRFTLRSLPRFRFVFAAALGAGALLASPRAEAYDVLATDCNQDPFLCKIGTVKFDRTDALPIEWMFDTG